MFATPPIRLPGITSDPVGGRSTSIITLVATLIHEAYRDNASDIHLDPAPTGLRVRMRIDGLLTDRHLLPLSVHHETIARIKVLAGLRTDEHQAAQDGRFRQLMEDLSAFADIRVSIAPTYYGENAVLRMLPDTSREHSLASLGFDEAARAIIEAALQRPDGMILSTGPTGSGKTTTLYALLRLLHQPETALVTIEDPVEYAIDGVKQIPTQARTGLTFAKGLRAILRQDPDVIMVGEIRDKETAEIAIQAALTGHLVLSTLHTNDAPSAITRLVDMGIEPYLLSSCIVGVLAQRLVRRICPECKETYLPTLRELQSIGIKMEELPNGCLYRGKWCAHCYQTGFKGRQGVYELMPVNNAITKQIVQSPDAIEMRRVALAQGMISLLAHGAELVKHGVSTVAEVLRVARGIEEQG